MGFTLVFEIAPIRKFCYLHTGRKIRRRRHVLEQRGPLANLLRRLALNLLPLLAAALMVVTADVLGDLIEVRDPPQ